MSLGHEYYAVGEAWYSHRDGLSPREPVEGKQRWSWRHSLRLDQLTYARLGSERHSGRLVPTLTLYDQNPTGLMLELPNLRSCPPMARLVERKLRECGADVGEGVFDALRTYPKGYGGKSVANLKGVTVVRPGCDL